MNQCQLITDTFVQGYDYLPGKFRVQHLVGHRRPTKGFHISMYIDGEWGEWMYMGYTHEEVVVWMEKYGDMHEYYMRKGMPWFDGFTA